jgi:hypothetical protein
MRERCSRATIMPEKTRVSILKTLKRRCKERLPIPCIRFIFPHPICLEADPSNPF